MAEYDDPDFDPETHEAIKAQAVVLGDGLATLYLPKDWRVTKQDFLTARLTVTWLDGAWLFLEASSYEATEDIRNNALAHFLSGPNLPQVTEDELVRDANGRPDYEKITQRAGGYALPNTAGAADVRGAVRIWRRISILRPDHVRIIDAQLYMPEEDADTEEAERIRHYIDHLLPETVFADRVTGADRIAPSPDMAKVSFWDTIFMRLPADWPDAKRSNPDGTGRYLIDDPGPDSPWTLWIDYDAFLGADAGIDGLSAEDFARRISERSPAASRNAGNVWFDPMPDRPDEAAVKVLTGEIDHGDPIRILSWYKVARVSRGFIMGSFNWVVVERVADEPAFRALTEAIETEVLNAVILDKDAGKLAPAPQGRA